MGQRDGRFNAVSVPGATIPVPAPACTALALAYDGIHRHEPHRGGSLEAVCRLNAPCWGFESFCESRSDG
jgi:hypothetical protein